jgi:hypothetical protein
MNYKDRIHVDLHVMDSVDEQDFASGKTDAAMLKKRLANTAINIVPHVARNVDSLTAALGTIVEYRPMYMCPRKAIPYIHIGCHGEKDRLILTDGEHVSWEKLSELLFPLQEKTDYNIPISLSSCWGYHGAGLAYVIDPKYQKRRPYYSLVGPTKQEYPTPLCDAFARFYRHLLVEFEDTNVAVKSANAEGEVQLDFTRGSILTENKPFTV